MPPRASQASCSRRPAVRSTAPTSASTTPTPGEARASSATPRASASSRAQTPTSRSAGRPRPASPGGKRSSRRRIQTAERPRWSGRASRAAASRAAKAAGAAPVSASAPSPPISCHWPRESPPPGRAESRRGSPRDSRPRTGPAIRSSRRMSVRSAASLFRLSPSMPNLVFAFCSSPGEQRVNGLPGGRAGPIFPSAGGWDQRRRSATGRIGPPRGSSRRSRVRGSTAAKLGG